MEKNFYATDWENYLPQPICEEYPQYSEFYKKAWELARAHVKTIPGMPQSPYMDEAFCDTQVWIWDTCFMTLFCKFAGEVFPGVETFKNFYSVLYEGKPLPAIIPTENEPFWTGAKPGEPFNIRLHIADNPPLLAWAEYENALMHGDKGYLEELLLEKKSLQRHYEWLENLKEKKRLPNVSCMTHWISEKYGYKWEGGASGMDNTPRGRTEIPANQERPNNPDMLWIDAICQQALSAKMISKMFTILDESEQAKVWQEKYEQKKKLVNEYYWDEKDKFYYDIDCNDFHFYKVPTIASYWTMTAGIATKEQAQAMVEYLKDETLFGGQVPFTTIARNDADFVEQGKYWHGSMWLPTSYATLKGLTEYGYHKEAQELAGKLLWHMWKTYEEYEPHTIWECYSPCAYKPATQVNNEKIVRPDFCGWSALGPISVYLEYVLGFHTINAFERKVEWQKPELNGEVGVKNLRFGDVVTDIVANGNTCKVQSNAAYELKINGKIFQVNAGENIFSL